MITAFVLALALALPSPLETVVAESVDLIELNHFHDGQGRHVFDQYIFYEWSESDDCYRVRGWVLVDEQNEKDRLPSRTFGNRLFHVRYYDGTANLRRHITAAIFRESWTQTDPERMNKARFPEQARRILIHRTPTVIPELPIDVEKILPEPLEQ